MNHLVYLALVFLSLYSLCLSLPHEQTYTLIVGGLSLSLCVFLSILYNVCDLLLSPLYGETNKAPSCINKLELWLCGVSLSCHSGSSCAARIHPSAFKMQLLSLVQQNELRHIESNR